MALLELEINCLCLYVRDRGPTGGERVLHVLMPKSDGHGPHAGHHKHVVRMFHKDFKKPGEDKKGRSMEGWALVLGEGKSNASLTLKPATTNAFNAEIANITSLSGGKVPAALVADGPNGKVAARITLRGGKITNMVSEAKFKFGTKVVSLAHQVTWQIQGIPHKLDWRRLNAPATEQAPLATLADLSTETNFGYLIRVYHVMEKSLPPGTPGSLLTPAEVKEHFAMLYPLVGIDDPDNKLLPEIAGQGTDGAHCVPGGGEVAHS